MGGKLAEWQQCWAIEQTVAGLIPARALRSTEPYLLESDGKNEEQH